MPLENDEHSVSVVTSSVTHCCCAGAGGNNRAVIIFALYSCPIRSHLLISISVSTKASEVTYCCCGDAEGNYKTSHAIMLRHLRCLTLIKPVFSSWIIRYSQYFVGEGRKACDCSVFIQDIFLWWRGTQYFKSEGRHMTVFRHFHNVPLIKPVFSSGITRYFQYFKGEGRHVNMLCIKSGHFPFL